MKFKVATLGCLSEAVMSALGQQQTSTAQEAMSAFGRKADMPVSFDNDRT
jgi:hypothetical protein